MPKGKKAQQSIVSPRLDTIPGDIQLLITRMSSIIDLIRITRASKTISKFYFFKCVDAKKHGDNTAATELFHYLTTFANHLNDALNKALDKSILDKKCFFLFTKLTDAFQMARDQKLKSKIARTYFENLQKNIPYAITDNAQVSLFLEHLKYQISVIDVAPNFVDKPFDRRLAIASKFETLFDKATNDKALIAQEATNAIKLFKAQELAFDDDQEKTSYLQKLDEHLTNLAMLNMHLTSGTEVARDKNACNIS